MQRTSVRCDRDDSDAAGVEKEVRRPPTHPVEPTSADAIVGRIHEPPKGFHSGPAQCLVRRTAGPRLPTLAPPRAKQEVCNGMARAAARCGTRSRSRPRRPRTGRRAAQPDACVRLRRHQGPHVVPRGKQFAWSVNVTSRHDTPERDVSSTVTTATTTKVTSAARSTIRRRATHGCRRSVRYWPAGTGGSACPGAGTIGGAGWNGSGR